MARHADGRKSFTRQNISKHFPKIPWWERSNFTIEKYNPALKLSMGENGEVSCFLSAIFRRLEQLAWSISQLLGNLPQVFVKSCSSLITFNFHKNQTLFLCCLFFVLSLHYICYLCDHIMIDKTTSKRLQILYLDPDNILLSRSPVPRAV